MIRKGSQAMFKKSILFIIVSILYTHQVFAGTLLIDYGFEDWIGDNGTASPAPGYIYSSAYPEYWQRHMDSTEVINGNALEGNFYQHIQFCTSITDPLLGRTATSVNASNTIGYNGTYPTGSKEITKISTDVLSNTILLRFYFRCSDDWSSNQNVDGGGGLKFIRLYGTGGTGDPASALLKILNDGDSTNPKMGIYDPGASRFTWYSTGVNYQDGNWHSIVFRAVRNFDDNRSGNVTISFWVDDWDMVGSGISQTITAAEFGGGFDFVGLNGNWSAQYPSALMSMDIDKVEVWDGMPDDSASLPVDSDPTITIASPTTGTTYASSLDTVTLQGTASDDNGLAAVTWSSSSNQQGSISSDLNNWSTGAITLQEGANLITVTATDTGGQTSSDMLTVNYIPEGTAATAQIWDANTQTGDPTWSDSTANWSVRALVEGSSITQSGDVISLGIMGRSSSNYQIKKVSIAEVDPAGGQGAVVDSTWTRVTFDGRSVSNWSTDVTTIPAGGEKVSDPVDFSIDPLKNYYVTYTMESPSTYLVAPSDYQQLYFDGADHADDIDWTNNGCSTYNSRLHAISSIYVSPDALLAPQGVTLSASTTP